MTTTPVPNKESPGHIGHPTLVPGLPAEKKRDGLKLGASRFWAPQIWVEWSSLEYSCTDKVQARYKWRNAQR